MNEILIIINQIREGKGYTPVTVLTRETHLRNDLYLDSFDLAELTVRIEDAFDVDIFQNGIVNTVGEILDILNLS